MNQHLGDPFVTILKQAIVVFYGVGRLKPVTCKPITVRDMISHEYKPIPNKTNIKAACYDRYNV